ncbi:MAG: hypothetical protein ACOCZ7_04035, partial [Armatimonadota bacterium]
DEGWRLETRAETRVYENTEAAPRAFVPTAVEPMADDDAVFAAITDGDDPFVARVTGDAGRWEAAEAPDLTISEYEANSVLVTGEMLADSWVVLADVVYPGWRAFADGVEAPIVPADLVRRAVHLDEPARQLRFVFLPESFRVGMFGTMLALAALGALSGAVVVGRRRS